MELTNTPFTAGAETSSASPVPLSAASSGTFITYGEGPDLDSALDDATSSAWFDLGRSHTSPSVANVSPDRFTVTTETPVPLDVAILRAQQTLTSGGETSIAVPVAPQNMYKRRRVTVRLEDVALEAGDTIGRIIMPSDELVAAVLSAIPDSDSELLGSLELKRQSARYKAVAEKFTAPRVSRWGVFLAGNDTPLEVVASQSEARRSAMAKARSGEPVAGVARYEIRPVVTRGETDPFVAVRRDRVKQVLVIKAELHLLNPTAKQRTIGFVIAGRPAS